MSIETLLISGRVWRLGNDIDTDQLIPSQYLVLEDRRDMASHCLETCRVDFATDVRPGDIVVAGDNFGCGSSREQAVLVLKTLGVGAVIAKSFSRIFFRNAINNALPVIVSPRADELVDGADVKLNLSAGTYTSAAEEVVFQPFSGMPKAILESGGLIPYLKQQENLTC